MFKKRYFVLIVILLGVGASIHLKSTTKEEANHTASDPDSPRRRGETGQTLSPSEITDPTVSEDYQIAKDIPHILDSIKCYCLCDMNPFKREIKSLLSCYVDTHAAT